MTWLLIGLFTLNSFHIHHDYTPKQYELVRQLSLLSVKKLDHSNCVLDYNYYADEKYFMFQEVCKEKVWLKTVDIKKIVAVDIKWMTFKRFRETQFE